MPYDFLENIQPREYQKEIFKTCKEKNCLVVIPTGLGKTLIALMLSIERLKKFPNEKILFLAPTKPLAEQHLTYFKKYLPELFGEMNLFTGAINSEKRKKIWQNSDIVFSTPQCVDGNTLIFTKEGPIKISEFFKKFEFKKDKKNHQVKTANIKEQVLGYKNNKISFVDATKAIKLETKNIIELKTEIGNNINCTRDHPLLTINKEGEIFWKQANQLKEGNYIAASKKIKLPDKKIKTLEIIPSNIPLKVFNKDLTKKLVKQVRSSKYSRYYHNYLPLQDFLKLSEKFNLSFSQLKLTDNYGKSSPIKLPLNIDKDIAYIIGAMLGDGHLGDRKNKGGEVVFSDLDRESVNKEFQKIMNKLFGVKMKKDSMKGLISYNSALSIFLNHIGIPKGNKTKKLRIPRFLFFADKKTIRGFIKGIFDTDGNASTHSISISSANSQFIHDLKWLFLKIGILGNIEKTKNKGNINGRKIRESELFTFRFSGRKNIEEFLKTNPDKEKCKKLIKTLNETRSPNTRSKEILPAPKLIREIQKENPRAAAYYRFSCLSIDNLRDLSKKTKGHNSLKLKTLLNLPVRWVKIKSKKEIKCNKEVYDLTIDKHHNFIANYLINHNCIANDLKKNLYNIKDVCLLIQDEAHRCMKNYDYNFIAKNYKLNGKNQRIIGLTASPGSESKKIKQICNNLSIQEVEIRTRQSPDVKQYLQELEIEKKIIDFPPEFEEMRHVLNKLFERYVEDLRKRNMLHGPTSKTNLLKLQKNIIGTLSRGNKNWNYLLGVSSCASAIKIQHSLELLETQTLESFYKYLKKLFNEAKNKKSKGVVKLVAQPEFNYVYMQANELLMKKREHPKLEEISNIIQKEKKNNKDVKLIIFTQFRDTAKTISDKLNKLEKIKSKVFVGQAKKDGTGMNQKQQQKIIQDFSQGKINILVSTSIAEEGLDIPEVNAVIFYEPIPSAIRAIQRAGRTARLIKGKLIMLITKNTRDETFYYVSRAREKGMHSAIENIKKDLKQKNLSDFKK